MTRVSKNDRFKRLIFGLPKHVNHDNDPNTSATIHSGQTLTIGGHSHPHYIPSFSHFKF